MSHTEGPGTLSEHAEASEQQLLEAAQAGDREAVTEIVDRYMPIVERIARRHHAPGNLDDVDDLIQVGAVGLLEALSRFSAERGSFAAFAATTVSGTIKRHFRDRGWRLRIPRSLHDTSLQLRRVVAELESRSGRPPTDAEVARETGLEPELVSEARALMRGATPVPLQGEAGADAPSLEELVGEEDPGFDRAEDRDVVGRLVAGLDRRDREVLALRFVLDHTQVEIASRVGVSQMQVSRLLRRALGTMRSADEQAFRG
jgi:RNA polymerase sigma-B factor